MVILRQAEALPAPGDKLVLFAAGILLFGIPLQAGFAMMSYVQRRFSRLITLDRAAANQRHKL